MNKRVMIGEILLDINNYAQEVAESEPTGNKLRKMKFDAIIKGKTLCDQLQDILQGTFVFKIPEESLEIKAKAENKSWSYRGDTLNDDTEIRYDFDIIELDKDLPEDWNFLTAIFNSVIMNWIRTRALSSILIGKGLTTESEYIKKVEEIAERDYDNLKRYLGEGLPENYKKKDQ